MYNFKPRERISRGSAYVLFFRVQTASYYSMKSFKYIFGFSLILVLSQCGAGKKTVDSKGQPTYQENAMDIEVDKRLFHFKPDSSRLYVSVSTKNLLYARNSDTEPTASIVVTIRRRGDSNPIKSFRIQDTDAKKKSKTLIAFTNFYLPKGEKSKLIVTYTDENRSRSVERILTSDKTNVSNRQNFLITSHDGAPLFTDRVKPYGDYNLHMNSEIAVDLNVLYYNRAFPLPPPPFAMYDPKPFEYKPDSITTLPTRDKEVVKIKIGSTGFYHINPDTTSKEGITLFVSDPEFPELKTIDDLMGPLRYLLSSNEFENLEGATDRKQVLENMWVSWAGSKERARKSIAAYYNRVERSNIYFSSHVEGWKSDRGIIYIIYGKPNKVYRTDDIETWIYGEENNPLSITFYFLKVINPFTDNDYRLNREEIYKPSWYRSVNAWRDGRIY